MSKSSSLFLLRLSRHLSTTAQPPPQQLSISQLKHQLKLTNIHNADQAIKLYNNFISTHPSFPSPSSTRHAQEFTVRLLAKSNRFDDIVSFLESHKSYPQYKQEKFLSSIIRSYGVAKMYENAENTYNEMGKLGITHTSLSFNCLLNACVNCGMFDRVVEFFNTLPGEFGFEVDKFSYGVLIKSYCKMGKPEIGVEKMEEMSRRGFDVDVVVYNTILHAFYETGKRDEADRFWDESVKSGGFVPDVGSYNLKLLNIRRDGKDVGEVKELVEGVRKEMKEKGVKLDVISYNYILKCYCENGMMDEAERVYGELRKGKLCLPNVATFTVLVDGLCRSGRFGEAYEVYKDSVKEHKTLEVERLRCLVEGLVGVGRKNDAKVLVQGLMRKGMKKEAKGLIKAMNEVKGGTKLLKTDGETVDFEETGKVVDSDETEKVVDFDEIEKTVDSDEMEKVGDSDETEKVVDSSENQETVSL